MPAEERDAESGRGSYFIWRSESTKKVARPPISSRKRLMPARA